MPNILPSVIDEMNPEAKKQATINALLSFGNQMLQPTPYKRGFLPALSDSVMQGYGAYGNTLGSVMEQMRQKKLDQLNEQNITSQISSRAIEDDARTANAELNRANAKRLNEGGTREALADREIQAKFEGMKKVSHLFPLYEEYGNKPDTATGLPFMYEAIASEKGGAEGLSEYLKSIEGLNKSKAALATAEKEKHSNINLPSLALRAAAGDAEAAKALKLYAKTEKDSKFEPYALSTPALKSRKEKLAWDEAERMYGKTVYDPLQQKAFTMNGNRPHEEKVQFYQKLLEEESGGSGKAASTEKKTVEVYDKSGKRIK